MRVGSLMLLQILYKVRHMDSIKKKSWIAKLLLVTSWMNLEDIMLSVIRQRLSAKELMVLNCGVGEDWESLGLQGYQTSQS